MKTWPRCFTDKTKSLLLLIIFFLLIFAWITFSPIKETFEYNQDEGIETIKSSLFLKGFPLYKEVWNDQPPLFTVILAYWFKLFGLSVYSGRILTALFSGLLLWALYQTVRKDWGATGALTAAFFLFFSAGFIRLSSSIMIGLPALSLGMFSIYLTVLYKKRNSWGLLALSGLCLALSLQIKFFTAILILPAMSILLQPADPQEKQKPLTGFIPAFAWLGVLSCVYLTVILIFFYPDLHLFNEQLFATHLKKLTFPGNDFSIMNVLLLQDYGVLVLALSGVLVCLKQKNWGFLPPFIWLSLAIIVISRHRPIWDHYCLLFSIPICWLAGISIGAFLRGWPFKGWLASKKFPGFSCILLQSLTAMGIFFCLANLGLKSRVARAEFTFPIKNQENEMLDTMLKFKGKTLWMITDAPIFAFYASIPVPPEIAVATVKRRFSEGYSKKYLAGILKKYEPEQILLGRFEDYPSEITSYIKSRYSQVKQIEVDQRTLLPDFFWVLFWQPVGKFLPPGIRFTTNEWLYHKIWYSWKLPVLRINKHGPKENMDKTTLKLSIRNDILENF
jgi:hypothetical protein